MSSDCEGVAGRLSHPDYDRPEHPRGGWHIRQLTRNCSGQPVKTRLISRLCRLFSLLGKLRAKNWCGIRPIFDSGVCDARMGAVISKILDAGQGTALRTARAAVRSAGEGARPPLIMVIVADDLDDHEGGLKEKPNQSPQAHKLNRGIHSRRCSSATEQARVTSC